MTEPSGAQDIVGLLRTEVLEGAVSLAEAVWRLLESQRGRAACSSCLAGMLGTTRRIDRAIMGAEGRGASRRYGSCPVCGKDRLLCGLPAVP